MAGIQVPAGGASRTLELWEDEPVDKPLESLLSSGVNIVVFNPCMSRPAQGDFMTTMQANIKALGELFNVPY
jgi:hypothetical protein